MYRACYIHRLIHFDITLLSTVYRNDWLTLIFNCFSTIQSGSINQWSCLIYFCDNFFDTAKETNIYEIKLRKLRLQILTCFIFLDLFSKKTPRFPWRRQTFRKSYCSWKEQDDIDIDNIGNLDDSLRLLFIDEEYGNLIVVNDGGELTKNINQKKTLKYWVGVQRGQSVIGRSLFSLGWPVQDFMLEALFTSNTLRI